MGYRITYIFLLLIQLCLLPSIFPYKINASQENPYINEKITIASEPDYPPYCIVDDAGNADGFSVDLFKAAAASVGLEVDVKIGVWNMIKTNLAEGGIDALPLVGRTLEREEMFDFTLPYMSLHGAVFVRRGTTGINSLDDLYGKEIVVMKGDNAEEFVRRYNVSENIFTTNTFREAFQQLAGGRYDAVIMQRVTGINLLKEMGLLSVVPLDLQLPQFRQDFCFAVRKGDYPLLNKLNEGLSIVIADGTYEEIRLKWFGPAVKEELTFRDIFRIAVSIFIPMLIIMSVFWIIFLRRQVRKQTMVLNNEITGHRSTLESLRKQKLLLNEMEKVSKSGGWEYDIEKQKINWTEGVFDIYGVSSSDFDPSGYEDGVSFYSPKDQKIIDRAFTNLLETGEPFDLELQFRSFDGADKWVRSKGLAEIHENKIIRVFGSITEITDRKERETELRKLKDELEDQVAERTAELQEKVLKLDKSQKAMLCMVEDLNIITAELKEESQKLEFANKELEAFAYSVSHDLRAPLRAISGFAKFLTEDYSDRIDDEGKRLISTIRQNAAKMDKLISDLLNLARVSRKAINPVRVDMGDVAWSVFQEVASDKEKKEFSLTIEKMPSAICDLSLIKQVWHNLISNALKYSARSEVKKILIGSYEADHEITFYIKDYGAGFDGKYKHKLFGPFYRLHKHTEFEGTGVGLAIVQSIIYRHKGRVWAEGKINQGATLFLSLPRKEING